MSSNNNQILSSSNFWNHFLAGRLNSSTNMIPSIPNNFLFPYLPLNKQQFEPFPPPYSFEAIQMFRSMLNHRNYLQQNLMHQNVMSKSSYLPSLFGSQKSADLFLNRSSASSNLNSPIDQGLASVGESSSSFENNDGDQKKDISLTRCPVCNQPMSEFEMESHLQKELGILTQNSRLINEEINGKQNLNASKSNNAIEEDFDFITIPTVHSQNSYQISLIRYKNFEKIRFNRHQREKNFFFRQKSKPDNFSEKYSYLQRPTGARFRQQSSSLDDSASVKKIKMSKDSVDMNYDGAAF